MKRLFSILFLLLLAVSVSAKGRQVDFVLSGMTNSDLALNGGKVYTYETGGLTPKTCYTDSDLTVAAANPFILDSNGRGELYTSGRLKMVIHDSEDNLIDEWADLDYSLPASNADYLATDYGDGSKSDDTLSTLATTIGSAQSTIILTAGNWVIDANLTLAANIRVKMEQGAYFTISSGKTLTINGYFDAPVYNVFRGAGTDTLDTTINPFIYDYWDSASGSDITMKGALAIVGSLSGVTTLTATTINATILGGKLTAGSVEIEGSNFDINGGTLDMASTPNFTTGINVDTNEFFWDGANNMLSVGQPSFHADKTYIASYGDITIGSSPVNSNYIVGAQFDGSNIFKISENNDHGQLYLGDALADTNRVLISAFDEDSYINAGTDYGLVIGGTSTTYRLDVQGSANITTLTVDSVTAGTATSSIYNYTADQHLNVSRGGYYYDVGADTTDSWVRGGIVVDLTVIDTDGVSDGMEIPIYLTDGLSITGYAYIINDVNHANGKMTVKLFYNTMASPSSTQIGSTQTSAGDGSTQTLSETGLSHTVDNDSNDYYIQVYSGTENGTYTALGGYISVQ